MGLHRPLPSRERILVFGGAGCLAADTIININRAGKGSRQTIKHIAHQSQGLPVITERVMSDGETLMVQARGWDLSIPTRVARADRDVVRLGGLKAAWYSGIKETFTVTTDTGRTVRATAEHPFLTTHDGFKALGDLRVGEALQVNSGRSDQGKAPKPQYRYADTKFHPHQTVRSTSRNRFGVPVHRLVVEADLNGLTLMQLLEVLRTDAVVAAELLYLNSDVHVHHRDHDTFNNSRENLEVLDSSAHHRHHAEIGAGNHVLWQVGSESVVSITPYGSEPTYDIEVDDDPHNFLANGFVVHNTGKTNSWLQIAAKSVLTRSDAKFYVADTDYTVARSIEEYPKVYESGLLEYNECPDWTSLEEFIKKTNSIMRPHDWMVVDMVGAAWEMVQEEYVERIFGKDIDEFFLDARKEMKKGGALDGRKDWGVINKMYRTGVSNPLMQCKGHLFACASAKALDSETESKENKALYARHGVKPVGQKTLSHLFHTVLWMQAPSHGQWTMSTVKDRARASHLSEPVGDFCLKYLVGTAGWKLA